MLKFCVACFLFPWILVKNRSELVSIFQEFAEEYTTLYAILRTVTCIPLWIYLTLSRYLETETGLGCVLLTSFISLPFLPFVFLSWCLLKLLYSPSPAGDL